jgi:hypothetical protein
MREGMMRRRRRRGGGGERRGWLLFFRFPCVYQVLFLGFLYILAFNLAK